ncbi:GNAT family N-acetyltransferase [Halorussus pelagicus]|uniref:GNAT family N-acetyltransferase n=1 Tax=Halorussus pelagicus TaxID=2505977 RepID=UPI000FFB23F7|nr:GNAT family N-acetyltransferase [Halorussus pelagicus]
MVGIEVGTTADADAVADLWVALADGQREFDSHLLAEQNRQTLRETIAQRAVADELLVARADDESRETDDNSKNADDEPEDANAGGETDETGGDETDDAAAEPDTSETDDAPLVGFVTFGIESNSYEQDTLRGIVQNLYVVSERRSEGVGSALLDAAESELSDAGADAVSLEVMADNADARRFYRRHGYAPHRIELEKSVENDTLTKE